MVTANEYATQTAKDLLIAAAIFEALDEHSLSVSQIHDLFSRNQAGARIQRALAILERAGLASQTRVTDTSGRPATVWTAM